MIDWTWYLIGVSSGMLVPCGVLYIFHRLKFIKITLKIEDGER